jgi:hypothetical protein
MITPPDLGSNPGAAQEAVADVVETIANAAEVVGYGTPEGPAGAGLLDEAVDAIRGAADLFRAGAVEARAEASGIVYKRVDVSVKGGKPYIGRVKSQARYLARQSEHARANPKATYKYTPLETAKPGRALRNAEQRQIEAHGGPTNKSNPHGGTENQRHEIKECPTGTRVC